MRDTIYYMLLAALAAAATSAYAARTPDGVVPNKQLGIVEPVLGDYTGNWNTELTPSDQDDISRYDLTGSIMRVAIGDDRRLGLRFYANAAAADRDDVLDLLGFGCNSAVGRLEELNRRDEGGTQVVQGIFDFDWGRCPSRVHAVASNKLIVEFAQDGVDGDRVARLMLLRKVRGDYKVYAKIDGRRQEVKVRTRDDGDIPGRTELEICVNEHGELKCFPQQEKTRLFGLPVPFPGATVVWWTRKTPRLDVEKDKALLYHEGVYVRTAQ